MRIQSLPTQRNAHQRSGHNSPPPRFQGMSDWWLFGWPTENDKKRARVLNTVNYALGKIHAGYFSRPMDRTLTITHPLVSAIAGSRFLQDKTIQAEFIKSVSHFANWAVFHPDFPTVMQTLLPQAILEANTPDDLAHLGHLLKSDPAVPIIAPQPQWGRTRAPGTFAEAYTHMAQAQAEINQYKVRFTPVLGAMAHLSEQDIVLRKAMLSALQLPDGKARVADSQKMLKKLGMTEGEDAKEIIADLLRIPYTAEEWQTIRHEALEKHLAGLNYFTDQMVKYALTHPGSPQSAGLRATYLPYWKSGFDEMTGHVKGDDLQADFDTLLNTHPSHAYLYGKWAATGDTKAFEKLYPHLMMTHRNPALLANMLGVLENRMDNFHNTDNHGLLVHANEAEMMSAAFGNPNYPIGTLGKSELRRFCTSITSISYFWDWNVKKLPTAVLEIWGRAANWSYGFLGLKYDARKNQALNNRSLLEAYGTVNPTAFIMSQPGGVERPVTGVLKALETKYGRVLVMGPEQWQKRKTDDRAFFERTHKLPSLPFKVDEQTTIVLYQPFMAVTHPDYGTLIVRNSSGNQKAGRNLTKTGNPEELVLPHPIYWSPTYMGSDLIYMDPEKVLKDCSHQPHADEPQTSVWARDKTRFYHLLDPSLYLFKSEDPKLAAAFAERFPDPKQYPHRRIEGLLNQLDNWKDDYCDWKLNPHSEQQFASAGFLHNLRMAIQVGQQQLAEKKPPVLLALANRRYPAFVSYPWENTAGKTMTHLPLNADNLDQLKRYLDSGNRPLAKQMLQNTDVYRFLNTGVSMAADVVLADN